jgi:hypothetical protein
MRRFASPKVKSVVRARKIEESTANFQSFSRIRKEAIELSSERNQLKQNRPEKVTVSNFAQIKNPVTGQFLHQEKNQNDKPGMVTSGT